MLIILKERNSDVINNDLNHSTLTHKTQSNQEVLNIQ